MADEQRPLCPMCLFPLDVGQTVTVRVPKEWTGSEANVAYICSNCETCCLTEETAGADSDLISIDSDTKSHCICSGDREVDFCVELKKHKSLRNCGTLKLKCKLCGAMKKFLSEGVDDMEEVKEERIDEARLSSSKADPPPAPMNQGTRFGYIGYKSQVEGAYNYPNAQPNLSPEIKNEMEGQSYPTSNNLPPGGESSPSPPQTTNDSGDGGVTVPQTPGSQNTQEMWVKSLEAAGSNPNACPYCNDPVKQQTYFNEEGFVTHVLCRECGARTNWTVGDGKTTPKTLVKNLNILQPADHVAWHRPCAIWHHAIIFDVDLTYNEVEVIHYNGGIDRVEGAFISIRRQWVPVDVADEDFYRIDYKVEECHPPDLVLSRACQRLTEAEYNPFSHNCEHFARWCKTGHERSIQIERIPIRMQKAADKIANTISSRPWFRQMSESDTMGHVTDAGETISKQTKSISDTITTRFNSLSTSIKGMFGKK